MGSKRKLATRILAAMPKRDTLVDLFCGGCAVAHAAIDGNKFQDIIINDINPMCTQLFTRALRGEYLDDRRWISRDDFERLKHTDPYVAIVWSFGNNMRDYMYSREVEPLKRAMHYAIYFSDFAPLEELLPGISIEGMVGVSEEYKRYTLVKHQVGNYLRGHDQAANANLQHSTAINLVTGGVGGYKFSPERSLLEHVNRRLLLLRAAAAQRTSRPLATTTPQPEMGGGQNQGVQYGLPQGGSSRKQRHLLRHSLREYTGVWHREAAFQSRGVLRMVCGAAPTAIHQQLLHALRALCLRGRIRPPKHTQRHRQQQGDGTPLRTAASEGARYQAA